MSNLGNTLILIFIGAATLLLAEGLYYAIVYRGQRRRAELQRRLRSLGEGDQQASFLRQRRVAKSRATEQLLADLPFVAQLERLLLQADSNTTVAGLLGLMALLSLGAALVLTILLQGNVVLGALGALIAPAIPLLALLTARQRRANQLAAQLPDALDMIVRSLRAGHSLASGFKLVAQELPAPIAVEFGRCYEEQNIGVEFRDALNNMLTRVPSCIDLKIFTVSVVVQRDTGGNLVEILEQLADTIRERFKFYGKLRALTSEGRLSCYILGALPFVCLALIMALNPKYFAPMTTDPMGPWIIGGGLFLWIKGFVWMRSLSKVDY